MRFKTLVDFGLAMWASRKTPVTLCVLGKPGIGKTASARALAGAMTEYRRNREPEAPQAICWVVDLSSCLPEDLNGLPFRGPDGVTHYAPQAWMAELCRPGVYGVLVLDDLPAASPSVQVASRQISLERRVHEARLSDGVIIIVTGNRREDKSNAATLPAHFRNSVCMLDIEVDVEEWATWAGSQPDINPVVPAFLRWKPSHLARTPADADSRGSYATPRSWAMLGRLYDTAHSKGVQTDVAFGLVGDGVATEFLAFAKLRDSLIDPKAVLKDPKGAVPNPRASLDTPDKQIAMCTSLAEYAVMAIRDGGKEVKKNTPRDFLRAIAWVTAHNREFVATAVATYTSNGGAVPMLVAAVRENANDPEIRPLMDFLGRAFK
jgi:hypothetical protein